MNKRSSYPVAGGLLPYVTYMNGLGKQQSGVVGRRRNSHRALKDNKQVRRPFSV